MADNTSVLSILVQLGVIGQQDVEAATQLLEDAKKQTSEYSKEMGVLKVTQEDVAVALGQSSKATEELGKAEEHAEGKAHGHLVTHREMHQILHLIGTQAGPGAAGALAAIGAASGLGLGLGIMAIREFSEALKKTREEAEKVRDTMAELDVSAWKDQVESANAAAESVFHFRQEMEKSVAQVDLISEKYRQQKTVLEEVRKEQEIVWQKMGEIALADAKARGLSASEVDAIRQKYEMQKRTNDLAKERADLQTTSAELIEREGKALELKDKATAAEVSLGVATGPGQHNQDKAQLEYIQKEMKGLVANALKTSGVEFSDKDVAMGANSPDTVLEVLRKRLKDRRDYYNSMPEGDESRGPLAEQLDTQEKALNKFEEAYRNSVDLQKALQDHKTEVDKLQAELSKSSEEYKRNNAEMEKLREAINALQGTIPVHQSSAGTNRRLGDFEHAINIASDFDAHGPGSLSDGSKGFIIVLAQAISGHKQTLEEAVRLVQSLASNMTTATSVLESHKGIISAVQKRLDQLEQSSGH